MSASDLAFVEEVEKRIAAVEPLTALSPSEQREKRPCAIVRALLDEHAKDTDRVKRYGDTYPYWLSRAAENDAKFVDARNKLANETAQREQAEAEPTLRHARYRALRIPLDQRSKNGKTLCVRQDVRHSPLTSVPVSVRPTHRSASSKKILSQSAAFSMVLPGTRTDIVLAWQVRRDNQHASSAHFENRTILVRAVCSAVQAGWT